MVAQKEARRGRPGRQERRVTGWLARGGLGRAHGGWQPTGSRELVPAATHRSLGAGALRQREVAARQWKPVARQLAAEGGSPSGEFGVAATHGGGWRARQLRQRAVGSRRGCGRVEARGSGGSQGRRRLRHVVDGGLWLRGRRQAAWRRGGSRRRGGSPAGWEPAAATEEAETREPAAAMDEPAGLPARQ